MQQSSNQDVQAAHARVRPRKRKTSACRKITVRLSEGVCGRLDTATDRPGVGKSMFVEAALEHFLNPAPLVKDLVQKQFDQMHARFDRLERDMRVMAETVALHARYQLAVTPPIPQERQREAIVLGDGRFRTLAEQVDRRVRQGRPLMQETIDRLNFRGQWEETSEQPPHDMESQENGRKRASEDIQIAQTSRPHAGALGRNSHAQQRPIHSANAHDGSRNEEQDRRSTPPESERTPREEKEVSTKSSLSNWRLVFSAFLPFAAGYFLSFLFRTINASFSPSLASDFGLRASEVGLLASVYFLVIAGAQIPIGVLLDRYGPRRIQSVLLVIAAGGASLFGNADSFAELLIGRAMIGLGVAASLMAGLKAIVTWFPRERIALVNGGMIMLGSLGAVTATMPTDWLMNWVGWRDLFAILTIMTVMTAGLIYFVAPESAENAKDSAGSAKPLTLRSVFSDPRFLRIAPLSAACIGSSWAMQSLWAASWLSDVDGFNHQAVVNQLFAMAVGISLGALLLGAAADRLRKRGVTTEVLLAAVGGLFMLAELALILRVPLPSILPWSIVSIVGAGTVLSYAIVAEYFPVGIAARANGALNLVHFGWAFALQYGIGIIVSHWAPRDGHYPIIAYQTAFALGLAFQTAALLWFAVPWIERYFSYNYSVPARPHHGVGFVPLPAGQLILDAFKGIVRPAWRVRSKPGNAISGSMLPWMIGVAPGIALCAGISAAALWLQYLEQYYFERPYVEALVIAILLGMLVRSFWQPSEVWRDGIALSAKKLLEAAVSLLGASISFEAIVASGPTLFVGIAITVVTALVASYTISRSFGLPQRISILIACGNSICGNSAIAAVAPIIGADNDEIASSIAFTAILGVFLVLSLPLLIPLLNLSETQYGVLAGLTVYAVPQVLAATVPISTVSVQLGTMVKLGRVLMLGPVVFLLSVLWPNVSASPRGPSDLKWHRLIPWFIIGFLALAALRGVGFIPQPALGPLAAAAKWLTVVSMAALGLGVDVRVLGRVGGPITFAVVLSLIFLVAASIELIWFLRVA